MQSKLSRQFIFHLLRNSNQLRPIENLNLFGIFCVVSISLLDAEPVAGTGALTQERLLNGVRVHFFNADIKLLSLSIFS